MRNRVYWTMATMAALATALALAGPARAQGEHYVWHRSDAPPANAVTGAGERKRPVCSFDWDNRMLVGGFFNGTCNAHDGNRNRAGTHLLRFLVATSGPAGGRWAETVTRNGHSYLPRGVARALLPGHHGEDAFVCSPQGTPGISDRPGVCPVSDPWDGAKQPAMWVLMRVE